MDQPETGQGGDRREIIGDNGCLVVDRYAVIGNPIRHSKSPAIHHAFAHDAGIELEYGVIECPPDRFQDAVQAFRDQGGRGMNVTAPFKLEARALADEVSDRAQMAGSVNTLKFENGLIRADNFDGIGLVRDLRDNLGHPIGGQRVLILGAGGAARGILQPILDEGPLILVLANRTADRARQAFQALPSRAGVRGGGYDEIGDEGFDLVINATSASMHGSVPPLPSTVFRPSGLAYELAYGLGVTPFLGLARAAGTATIVDGVGMLVEQAAESFAWWHGVRPPTRAMIEHLTVPLSEPGERQR
jgi:shikimate dehydrogenase